MENKDVEKAVAAAENEGLQVSEAAEVAAGEENKLENGGGGDDHEGMVAPVASGGGESELRAKRKRGRPRKQFGEMRQEFMVVPEIPASPQKRGRGRPRGSGKWQTLAAAFGGITGDRGGSNFTPHIIAIQEGENIVERILSFSQMTCESICILSASGSISIAEILLPARGGVLRYEDQFSIVSLNGSHTHDVKRGGKMCLLSVQLADPDGRLCGGAVAGSLIAAGPTQLVIATFRENSRHETSTRPSHLGSPMPSNGRVGVGVAVAMQAENGKVADGEVRVADQVAMNGPTVSQFSSAQPLDWKSSLPGV